VSYSEGHLKSGTGRVATPVPAKGIALISHHEEHEAHEGQKRTDFRPVPLSNLFATAGLHGFWHFWHFLIISSIRLTHCFGQDQQEGQDGGLPQINTDYGWVRVAGRD
jgi:hypothetical protein